MISTGYASNEHENQPSNSNQQGVQNTNSQNERSVLLPSFKVQDAGAAMAIYKLYSKEWEAEIRERRKNRHRKPEAGGDANVDSS